MMILDSGLLFEPPCTCLNTMLMLFIVCCDRPHGLSFAGYISFLFSVILHPCVACFVYDLILNKQVCMATVSTEFLQKIRLIITISVY